MYSAKSVEAFIRHLKMEVKDISVWIYSGFCFENILDNSEMFELLKLCDVLSLTASLALVPPPQLLTPVSDHSRYLLGSFLPEQLGVVRHHSTLRTVAGTQ